MSINSVPFDVEQNQQGVGGWFESLARADRLALKTILGFVVRRIAMPMSWLSDAMIVVVGSSVDQPRQCENINVFVLYRKHNPPFDIKGDVGFLFEMFIGPSFWRVSSPDTPAQEFGGGNRCWQVNPFSHYHWCFQGEGSRPIEIVFGKCSPTDFDRQNRPALAAQLQEWEPTPWLSEAMRDPDPRLKILYWKQHDFDPLDLAGLQSPPTRKERLSLWWLRLRQRFSRMLAGQAP
ncbi:MAG: hypothetical protein V1826_00375 [bacterium]